MIQIKKGKIRPKEVIFIQHSGHMVSQAICWLLERDIPVTLYQQDPETSLISDSDSLKRRIRGVSDNIIVQGYNADFRSKLTIKRFRTPASLRAVLVDKEIIVVSWYGHWVDADSKQLQIRGFENPGILLSKESSNFQLLYDMVNQTRISLDRECRNSRLIKLSKSVDLYES